MLAAVTSALTTVIQWIGSVITALTGEQGALAELLPLFAIGIAVSAFLLAIRGIRSLSPGVPDLDPQCGIGSC